MKAGVLEPVRGQLVEVRGLARPAEGAGGAEAYIVDQDDENIGRAVGGRSGSIGGNFVSGSLALYVVSPTGWRIAGIGRIWRWRRSFTALMAAPRAVSTISSLLDAQLPEDRSRSRLRRTRPALLRPGTDWFTTPLLRAPSRAGARTRGEGSPAARTRRRSTRASRRGQLFRLKRRGSGSSLFDEARRGLPASRGNLAISITRRAVAGVYWKSP